jgi:predicted metal-dependent RNase
MVSTDSTAILLDAGVKLGSEEEYPVIEDSQLRRIDGIFISHAHLDHTGYLPHIYTAGYKGDTFATKPTIELTNVLLSDYIRISNPKNISKEGMAALSSHFKIIEYGKAFKFRDLTIKFIPAGHILGSALICVSDGRSKLVYTGDINLMKTRLLDGADLKNLEADTLITESTYGAKKDIFPREHDTEQRLLRSVNETIKAGGKVMVPSFAVGRAQEVLFIFDDYMNSGVLHKVPLYVDGMINKALRIHRHNVIYCRKEMQSRILMSDYDPFKSPNFTPVETKGQRNKIVAGSESSIVVTTSGMLSGGPIMFYLSKLGNNHMNKLILVGYQAEGTLGRAMQDGAKTININGSDVRVQLDVETYHLSAHADRVQLESIPAKIRGVKTVFIVHGEHNKAEELREALAQRYHTVVPKLGESFSI